MRAILTAATAALAAAVLGGCGSSVLTPELTEQQIRERGFTVTAVEVFAGNTTFTLSFGDKAEGCVARIIDGDLLILDRAPHAADTSSARMSAATLAKVKTTQPFKTLCFEES